MPVNLLGKDIMTIIRAFIERHPLLSYFALTFAISWGGFVLVVGPGGFPGTGSQFDTLATFVVLAMLAGPSVAGLLLTGLVDGKAGLRELLSRLLRWRVGARWYAAALLTAPILAAAVLFALSVSSPIFTTDAKTSLVLTSVVAGLIGGFFEELGWTGFAVPRMRLRYGVLATGLVVGALWGVAHLPLYYWGSGDLSGTLSPALLLPAQILAWFLPFRVLMVWAYDRTGSLLLAMLMHASLTASQVIFASLTAAAPLFTYVLVFGAVLWVVVAAVALADHRHLSRQPLWRRVA
jgi:membrane protease YdiL (CAAX protease family)